MQPKVSILLPHFQTPTLTLLCLRLLRKVTDRSDYEVIVIDNGSADGSGEILRKIKWIKLLRRELEPCERPALSHGLALNLGLEHASSDFLVTLHTDTMVLRSDWLDFLLRHFERGGERCGAVGSWKMESTNHWRKMAKWFEHTYRRLRTKPTGSRPYIRSHCAMYRRQAIETHPQRFAPSEGLSAGEELHQAIEANGFHCSFVPPDLLGHYVEHLNHATMALNADFGQSDRYMPRTRQRTKKRIDQFFESINATAILDDDSLDLDRIPSTQLTPERHQPQIRKAS